MRSIDFDVQQVIDYLQGTCKTLDDAVTTIYPDMSWEDLTEEDHKHIDGEIFCCETCGWWCEVSEMVNQNECQDCDEDKDQEDED